MPAALTVQHAVGSEVHIVPEYASSWPARSMAEHGTFIVEAVPGTRGRTTYALRHKTSERIRLKAHAYMLAAGPHPSFAGIEAVPLPAVHLNGTVVEFKDGSQPGLWVVTGYTERGHKVFRLGGSADGRRNVSGARLEVVTLDVGGDETDGS